MQSNSHGQRQLPQTGPPGPSVLFNRARAARSSVRAGYHSRNRAFTATTLQRYELNTLHARAETHLYASTLVPLPAAPRQALRQPVVQNQAQAPRQTAPSFCSRASGAVHFAKHQRFVDHISGGALFELGAFAVVDDTDIRRQRLPAGLRRHGCRASSQVLVLDV